MSIDYGRYPMNSGQLPNRDAETGIRYGIIPTYLLADWIHDAFEPVTDECEECSDQDKCECELESDWILDSDGYQAQLIDNEIWVFNSPYLGAGSHCSPCAPGAVYLKNADGNVSAYTLGPEFFENEKPPYPIRKA